MLQKCSMYLVGIYLCHNWKHYFEKPQPAWNYLPAWWLHHMQCPHYLHTIYYNYTCEILNPILHACNRQSIGWVNHSVNWLVNLSICQCLMWIQSIYFSVAIVADYIIDHKKSLNFENMYHAYNNFSDQYYWSNYLL